MLKKATASILSFALVFSMLFGIVSEPAYAAKDYSVVRVKLSNANDGTINLGIDGFYTIDKNGASVTSDIVLTMQSSGIISVTNKSTGAEIFRGSEFKLVRAENQNGKTGVFKMYTTQSGNNAYLGSLSVSAKGTQFLVINYVPIEHYIYGVVAHEMNNTWPIEALKAQAVAARGYAAGRIGTYASYDLSDTPSDQVYKGFRSSDTNVIAAVDATQGQILTYNGKVILPYYAASNGGQTELTENIWHNKSAYCVMKDDEYDLRNPNSLNQKIFLPTDAKASGLDANLAKFLKIKVAPALQSKGLSSFEDQIEILGISDVQAQNAKYPAPSRSFTKVSANVKVRAIKGSSSSGIIADNRGSKPVEPSFQATEIYGANGPLWLDSNNNLVDSAYVQAAMEKYNADLAVWEAGGDQDLRSSGQGMSGQSDELTVPVIFDFYELKDSNKTYKLFTNMNLIMYYVEQANGGANLVNARFGHGVGMSQRGAQQMANEGKNYKDILNFYYSGVSLDTISYSMPSLILQSDSTTTPAPSDQNNGSTQTPSPTPSATPEVVVNTAPKAATGKALEKLTLYEGPGTKYKKVATIKEGGRLGVVALNENWVLVVSKSGVLGCVQRDKFLIDAGTAKFNAKTAIVSSTTDGKTVVNANSGVNVNINGIKDDYYKVSVKNYTGYAPISSLDIFVKNPVVPLNPDKQYAQAKKAITLYSNSSLKSKTGTVSSSHVFEILSKTKDGKTYNIVYNGKKGYISATNVKLLEKGSNHPNVGQIINKYLPKTGSTTASSEVKLLVGVGALQEISLSASKQGEAKYAQTEVLSKKMLAGEIPGKITGITVNMRANADSKSKIIVQLPKGETVSVLGKSGNFYKIRDSKGNIGFVSKDFISVQSSKIGTITGVTVNVRSKPNSTSSIVVQLPKGENVTVLSSSGEYYKVETKNGKVGYVADEFIVLGASVIPDVSDGTTSQPETQKPATTSQKPAASGVITGGSVNLRESASGNSKVLSVVPNGTRVNIFSKNGEYYKISHEGKIGYVLRTYIPSKTLTTPMTSTQSETQTVPSSTASNTQVKLGSISANTLSVRTESGKVIGSLKQGDVVEILSTNGNKYKIKSGNLIGFVEGSNVKSFSSLKQASVISSGLNIRDKASTDGKRLAIAYPKEIVYVIADNGEWLKVYYEGVVGFVLSKHVQMQ